MRYVQVLIYTIYEMASKTEAIECSLNLDRFGKSVRIARAEALGDTRDARQPDVMNHWSAPDRVKTFGLSSVQNEVILPALSATVIECEAL